MSELTIPERVAAGAAYLDRVMPGWWQRIDLERLDLSSTCNCVLGQEFGHFAAAPEDAYLNAGDAYAKGFDIHFRDEFGSYEPLTAEWRRLIESRRAGAVS